MTTIIEIPTTKLPTEHGSCTGLAITTDSSEHPLFAIRHNGNLHIYRNRCPHLGIPLEWMPNQFLDVDQQYIQCSTHGALFRIDSGLCVSGPCQGESLQPAVYEIDGDTISIDITGLEGDFD